MRVLFCTTGGLGHLLPLRPLAQALRRLGHEVAWVTAPDACPALQGEGFDLFAAGPTFGASRGEFRTAHAGAAGLTGESLSAYTFPRLFGAVLGPAMLEGVERAARTWRPDFVVSEPAALAVPLVCRQLGLRHATHGYGLRPPREYVEEAMNFFGPYWRARGLDVPAEGGLHRHLDLDIAPASLQASSGPKDGRTFRFSAYRPATTLPSALPAELQAALQQTPARRPRIYVTFGTVFNRSPALLVAARAAALLGGTVVVTVGPDGDLPGLAQLGAHVHVHRFVDQGALLRERSLKALLTGLQADQMSTTCRSNEKPTRQVVPSPASMLAVRWLMRTITPTTVFRCLSSKATFSPQRKSLRPARGAGGCAGSGAGRGAPGVGGSTAV